MIKNIENKLEDLKITLENVSFTYDGKRKVINNINLEISNNGLTSIVGESGSGKSTIASLILNINSATNGKVKFNNIDIENINDEIIYKNISLVSTNSYIFNGTILENLLMGNSNASEEEINKALEKSRLTGFINSLDKGLYTEVGEGGSSLSGGQKQRLALARAILGNRDFIIFDEATSNIDIESEEQIWKSIYELAKEKTVLVISHRLANVRDSKVIYVMKEGQLIESGTYSELVKTQGEYYKMINKQIELENIREVG